jgi:hypothetical protein
LRPPCDAKHSAKRLGVTACRLTTIQDGRIVHVRGEHSDRYAFDDFWS